MPDRAVADPESAGWPDIAAPATTDVTLPPFPAHLLPPALADMVLQAAESIQAPVDLAGMVALPVAASTLAGKVRFVGRPGHREHAMLWALAIAASSERKTPVFEALRAPLVDLAAEFLNEAAVTGEIRRAKLEMVEAQIKALKDEATKAALASGAAMAVAVEGELGALIAARRELEKPVPGLTEWVTSPTPEGLQRVMGGNCGRAAVFSDEGGLIGTLAGRYSGKDGADMDPFLSGYVGSPLRSPRAGSDRPYVDAAYLTMGLAVQPSVLEELAAVKGAEERGLVGRFLFALPGSLVGTRMYADSVPVDDAVAARYAAALKDWAVWQGSPDGGLVHIGLNDQAFKAYEKFHDEIEVRQAPGNDLHLNYTVSKIAGTTLRLAGLFHCFDLGRREALATSIGEDAMSRAIEMTATFFIRHGLHVADRIRSVGPQGIEARILGWAKGKGHHRFKLRDLTRALAGSRGSVGKAADLIDPLAELVDDGYLREVEAGNRTSREFEVNPGLFSAAQVGS